MNSDKLVEQLAIAYELSLSIGTSLTPKEICKPFLRRLIERTRFKYASVIVKKDNSLEELYTFPEVFAGEVGIFKRSDRLVIPLEDVGYLILGYEGKHIEVKFLDRVFRQFALYLKGAISNTKLLREIERRVNLMERLPIGIFIYDVTENEFKFVNEAFLKIFKVNTLEELHTKYPEIANVLASIISGGKRNYLSSYVEFRVKLGAEYVWLECHFIVEDGNTLEGAILDITHKKEHERLMLKQANTDSLTGLQNRNAFYSKLRQVMDIYKYAAVFFIDLDNFKYINDSLGHAVGDKLLKEFAEKLKSIVNPWILYRLGGDEFAILVWGNNIDHKVSELREKLSKFNTIQIDVDGYKINVKFSTGVSIYPYDAQSASQLLKSADIALYKAKELGRGTIVVTDSSVISSFEKEKNMLDFIASARYGNIIHRYYQPIFSLPDLEVIGYETLMRFKDETVSIPEIISLAEKTGDISAIEEVLIEGLLLDVKKFPFNVPLHINISPIHLYKHGFVEWLWNTVKDFGADKIVLEITESKLMKDIYNAKAIVGELKEKRFKVAIDDIGKGYSSLYYLKELPIDIVKIDMEFIRKIHRDEKSKAIVQAILTVTDAFNIRTIAEGVESEEQLDVLKAIGCDAVQGYLLGKPVPLESLLK